MPEVNFDPLREILEINVIKYDITDIEIDVKSNGKTLIGGGFTSFNEINRPYFAQIHGGVINGSGRIEFKVPTYKVGELSLIHI